MLKYHVVTMALRVATLRCVVRAVAAAIDYREREGLGAGSDGHYAYLWKHGTTGALTQPEINHAKRVRGWRRLGLQKDMVCEHSNTLLRQSLRPIEQQVVSTPTPLH